MSKLPTEVANAVCHPDAYQFLVSAYTSPTNPPFSVCYRQMVQIADQENWLPIPSERSLRRLVSAQFPRSALSGFRASGTATRGNVADAQPAKPKSRLVRHTFDVPQEEIDAMLAEQRRLRNQAMREIMARQSKGAFRR